MTLQETRESFVETRARALGYTPAQEAADTRGWGWVIWFAVVFLAGLAIGSSTWWALIPIAALAVANLIPARES